MNARWCPPWAVVMQGGIKSLREASFYQALFERPPAECHSRHGPPEAGPPREEDVDALKPFMPRFCACLCRGGSCACVLIREGCGMHGTRRIGGKRGVGVGES